MEAEDNLHDSFMTIYDKIEQYHAKGSFEGWMKRITVNTILQKFRKDEPLTLVTETVASEVEVEVDTCIELQTLLCFIQELPSKYRATFNLYVLDGYTHKEIGELLGTSIGTSKSNLARAKTILKEKIETKISKTIVGLLMILFGYLL